MPDDTKSELIARVKKNHEEAGQEAKAAHATWMLARKRERLAGAYLEELTGIKPERKERGGVTKADVLPLVVDFRKSDSNLDGAELDEKVKAALRDANKPLNGYTMARDAALRELNRGASSSNLVARQQKAQEG